MRREFVRGEKPFHFGRVVFQNGRVKTPPKEGEAGKIPIERGHRGM